MKRDKFFQFSVSNWTYLPAQSVSGDILSYWTDYHHLFVWAVCVCVSSFGEWFCRNLIGFGSKSMAWHVPYGYFLTFCCAEVWENKWNAIRPLPSLEVWLPAVLAVVSLNRILESVKWIFYCYPYDARSFILYFCCICIFIVVTFVQRFPISTAKIKWITSCNHDGGIPTKRMEKRNKSIEKMHCDKTGRQKIKKDELSRFKLRHVGKWRRL